MYAANLGANADLQEFFEDSTLVAATRFFRNRGLFHQLEEVVLPRLIRGGLKRRGTLRLWSAGCSDGRETFSLAMSARQCLDTLGLRKIKVYVRGSDISRSQIDMARKSTYPISAADEKVLDRFRHYFDQVTPHLWRVHVSIQRITDFVVEELTSARPVEPYDVLVCSLVLLYYEPEYRKRIILDLAKTIRDDGFIYFAPVNHRWMKSQGFKALNGTGPFYHNKTLSQTPA